MLLIAFFIFAIPLFSLEVEGHITENTIWTPDNNPYIVVHDIYVDSGVTLTIAPGTIVKLTSAELSEFDHIVENFYWQGGEAEAKMIWVNGKIIAEGTEQDSIIFTRNPDVENYHWGTIYLSPESEEISKFKYCKIEYPFFIGLSIMHTLSGAIEVDNGKVDIENCLIQNVEYGIHLRRTVQSVLIKDNIFRTTEEFAFNYMTYYIASYSYDIDSIPLIVGNSFYGTGNNICGKQGIKCSNAYPLYIVNNTFQDCSTSIDCEISHVPTYIYNNKFYKTSSYPYSHWTGISVDGEYGAEWDTVYIKKNEMYGRGTGIYADDIGYIDISENYLDSCKIEIDWNSNGKIYNNIVKNTGIGINPGSGTSAYNNIVANCDIGFNHNAFHQFCNNIITNNQYAFHSISSSLIENNIIISNNELYEYTIYNPQFRNCVLDFELPDSCMDAGGNIWDDPLFVDPQNADFHLLPESPCIDAGFDTTGYYCPFDMDYNVREWDGDEDGNTIIDIGPYEFASPQFGGICGTVYQTENGEPLDYVLLKINNEPGEFEFSDSSGYYEFRLPTGIYSLYASRVFYDDVVIEDIEVIDGEVTQLDFSMTTNLAVDKPPSYTSHQPIIQLYNYPNPVNPDIIGTNISFSLPKNTKKVELKIYNIKGQLIKTLTPMTNDQSASWRMTSVVWDGKDKNGKLVTNGIYLYKLSSDKSEGSASGRKDTIKKMIILK